MKVIELLTVESRWTRYAMGRDVNDHAIFYSHFLINVPDCFCLVGAVYFCYPDPVERNAVLEKLREAASLGRNNQSLADWNDSESTTFQMVRSVIVAANV